MAPHRVAHSAYGKVAAVTRKTYGFVALLAARPPHAALARLVPALAAGAVAPTIVGRMLRVAPRAERAPAHGASSHRDAARAALAVYATHVLVAHVARAVARAALFEHVDLAGLARRAKLAAARARPLVSCAPYLHPSHALVRDEVQRRVAWLPVRLCQ